MDILCNQCGKQLLIPEHAEGKTIRCPNCGFLFKIVNGVVTPVNSQPSVPPPTPSGVSVEKTDQTIPVSSFSAIKSGQDAGTEPRSGAPFPENGRPGNNQQYNSFVPQQRKPQPTAASFLESKPLVPTIVDVGSVISDSWRLFSNNLGMILGAFLISFLCSIPFSIPYLISGSILEFMMRDNESAVVSVIGFCITAFFFLVYYIGSAWLGIGMTRFLITAARGQTLSFSLLFSGGNALWRVFLLGLLFGLPCVLFGVFFIGGVVIGSLDLSDEFIAVAICVGIIAFLFVHIALIWAFFRVILSFFLIVDTGIRVLDSVRVSWITMRGNVLAYIVTGLFSACVFIAVILWFCVGYLLIVPYVQLLIVTFYLHATGQKDQIPAPEGQKYL